MNKLILILATLLITVQNYGQDAPHSPDKSGKYRYETNLPEKTYSLRNSTLSSSENIALKKNVANVSEWFHQNHPMIRSPKGYDMRALSNWSWGDFTTVSEWEYGIPAELGFLFELFFADGTIWSIEPPRAGILINNVLGGQSGLYFTPESIVEDSPRVDPSLIDKIRKATTELRKYFMIFPIKKELSPGVHYYESFPGERATVVAFNPNRPPYWIPVTVKEMADAHLAYYTLFQKVEIDRMVLSELKKEIAELSPEELAAPAYSGHDSHFVLKINGQGQGLQIMKFNPEYWDRSLPRSAIQLMSFWTSGYTEEQKAEDIRIRSYPNYPVIFANRINWSGVAGLIEKGK